MIRPLAYAHTLLDLVAPPRCAACLSPAWDDPRSEFCAACSDAMPPNVPRCDVCARPCGPATKRSGCPRCTGPGAIRDALSRQDPHSGRSAIAAVVAGASFHGIWRDLVLALKFARRVRAADPLARQMGLAVRAGESPGELVVPVPLSRGRRLRRGYNQAELLARPLARSIDRVMEARALRRVRGGPPMAKTAHSRRLVAMRGAFEADPRRVEGRSVLLVDDVLTTGATARAAAMALRRAGAPTVHVAVACRA